MFKGSLNPSSKKFRIHLAAVEAVDNMKGRIGLRENKKPGSLNFNASTDESGIRKAIKNGSISQSILHALLCLLFNEFNNDKYSQPYSLESVKGFLSSIKLDHNEPGSITKFEDFFAQLEIPEKFGDFEITIDDHWNFCTSDSDQEIEIDHSESIPEGTVFSKENIEKKIEPEQYPWPGGIVNNLIKNKYYYLIVVSIVGMIFFLFGLITKRDLPFDEIEIGNQIWSGKIDVYVSDSYCYEDIDHNCVSSGRLYSYKAAHRVADKFNGWEVPTAKEFEKLIEHLGGEKRASESLMIGGSSNFNASLSGYKFQEINIYDSENNVGDSVLKAKKDEFKYVSLGIEDAFWTSSIGEDKDAFGRYRPQTLRLNRTRSTTVICDCWTYSDALSLRLIKTNRGNQTSIIKE